MNNNGKKLKIIRKYYKWDRVVLADVLGISKKEVRRLERGKRELDLAVLCNLVELSIFVQNDLPKKVKNVVVLLYSLFEYLYLEDIAKKQDSINFFIDELEFNVKERSDKNFSIITKWEKKYSKNKRATLHAHQGGLTYIFTLEQLKDNEWVSLRGSQDKKVLADIKALEEKELLV
jgi:transcriptional regulator with XRE-family HTH domain